jgi:hypothetical protein
MPSAGLPMARLLAIVSGSDRADGVDAGLVGDRDRGAAGRLGAEDLAGLVLDQAELDQLPERLVHLGQAASRDRDTILVGSLQPACSAIS